MRPILLAAALASVVLASCASAPPSMGAPTASGSTQGALDAAIAGSWRTPANVARDVYRHPKQTLAFFGVRPEQTVIEIIPGGGWYSEILAPYLRANGQYIAAVAGSGEESGTDPLRKKFAADPAHFDRARIVAFDPKAPVFGPPASADVVLTFRNVHNWRMAGTADAMFRGFFAVLKPGGVLGVVEHRAKADVRDDDRSGYVGPAQVIATALAAGFVLDGQSEINANPRDTKDYPGGVWTLPPTNHHDARDDARYKAIGESDRMTLRFVKPRA